MQRDATGTKNCTKRVRSAGKHTIGVKREKTCNQCQAGQNIHLVPSARKQATGAKRENVTVCQPRLASVWLSLCFGFALKIITAADKSSKKHSTV